MQILDYLPIVNSNDEVIRVLTKADAEKSREFPKSLNDRNGKLMVAAEIKIGKNAEQTINLLVTAGVDVVFIQSSGDFEDQVALLKWIKEEHSQIEVIAGNVSTEEQAKRLVDAGADALGVGMGIESTCTSLL